MKKLTQISLLLLGLMVAFAGCDAAKKATDDAKDKVADMADIDFGDFDMKGLSEKFAGITDGFKSVTTDNVDGLTSKISDLTSSMDGMGMDKLTGPAKTFAASAVEKFGAAIKTAMEGISDEGLLGKLKPVVEALMEKIKAMG
jgi:hypothetical protein